MAANQSPGCCQCEGIKEKFDSDYVAKKLQTYQKSGPKRTTVMLVEALKSLGVDGLTHLDIGGGVGDVVHALLEAGAERSTNVEASEAYAAACRQEAARLGHEHKVEVIVGDFTVRAAALEPADIVTLDRVVCCYHDFRQLIELSLAKSVRAYGLVYPLDRWWVKLVSAIFYNLRFWLQGSPFRNYIHPEAEVESLIEARGFSRTFFDTAGGWQVVVYTK